MVISTILSTIIIFLIYQQIKFNQIRSVYIEELLKNDSLYQSTKDTIIVNRVKYIKINSN